MRLHICILSGKGGRVASQSVSSALRKSPQKEEEEEEERKEKRIHRARAEALFAAGKGLKRTDIVG